MPAEVPAGAGGETVSSVYVHAPFCVRRCLYCDFAVEVRRQAAPDEWLEALAGERAALEAEGRFRLAPRLETLYVGGGTPSLLGPGAMEGLARVLGPERVAGPELEWTAEATARDEGVANLSVDLIFGLPAHLGRDWRADLEAVLGLEVPHLSLYGLTVEPGTALGRAVRDGREAPVDPHRYEEEFLLAAELLSAAGYEHYEVSNFARPGARSRHNAVYWDGRPYLGLGNGAHSYLHPLRRWNLRAWDAYRERAADRRLPVEGREELDPVAHRLEQVWLGLRSEGGWPRERDATEASRRLVEEWIRRGLAVGGAGRVRLRARGWLLLDELAVELDRALADPGAGVADAPGPPEPPPSRPS